MPRLTEQLKRALRLGTTQRFTGRLCMISHLYKVAEVSRMYEDITSIFIPSRRLRQRALTRAALRSRHGSTTPLCPWPSTDAGVRIAKRRDRNLAFHVALTTKKHHLAYFMPTCNTRDTNTLPEARNSLAPYYLPTMPDTTES